MPMTTPGSVESALGVVKPRTPQPGPAPASTPQPGRRPTVKRGDRAKRLPGLDGLRALAVIAVLLFHLDATLIPGGFLGVDLFFVVSGYLITRLLLTEITQRGTLGVARFYGRRVRRLFPAVAALIVVVILACVLVWRDELATLPGSVISSLTYVTNWWLIGDHQSYFISTGRPPMLQHLWSLAIEEQYYLLWPGMILLITGIAWKRNKGRPIRLERVALVALALAVASTIAMAVIAILDNVPYESDSSRVYFGTDTHSMGLFLGSALGAFTVLPKGRWRYYGGSWLRSPAAGWCADAAAAGCLSVVIWKFFHQSEYTPGLYRGGFLVFDVFAVVVVWVVVSVGSKLGWLLERPILRGIGQRSYSIYLWHWPVVVVTRPGIDVHGPIWLIQLARIGLILLLAEASYRLVERPIRTGQWSMPRLPAGPYKIEDLRPLLGGIAGVTCLAVLLGAAQSSSAAVPAGTPSSEASFPTTIRPSASATPPAREVSPTRAPTIPHTGPHTALPTTRPSLHPSAGTTSQGSAGSRATVAPTRAPAPRPVVTTPYISAFGDSVLLGARPALDALDTHVSVNAVEGVQAYIVLNKIAAAHAAGQLGPIVEIHIGNNGVINPSQLSNVLTQLSDRKRVIVLNDHVPRDWQGINNQTLPSVAAHFRNVSFIDWNSIAEANPGWFYRDGLHLNKTGAAAYAQLILKAAVS
jgi:peptidoglycan/LPS O-acetylase OafA/YrhL